MKKIIYILILSIIPLMGLCFIKNEFKEIVFRKDYIVLLEKFFNEKVKNIEGGALIKNNKNGSIRYSFSKGFIDLYNYRVTIDDQYKIVAQYKNCKIYEWETETYWCEFDDITTVIATNKFSVVLSLNVASQKKNCSNKSKSTNFFKDKTDTKKLTIQFMRELIDYFIDNL